MTATAPPPDVGSALRLGSRRLRQLDLSSADLEASLLLGRATGLARLELILKGKQLGFTLTEIRDLIANQSEEPVRSFELSLDETQILAQLSMLQRQRDDIERAIEELRQTQERLSGANGLPHASVIAAAGAGAGASAP